MFTPTQLLNEINTDAKALGYSALVASGNDAGIAALMNATTGAGAQNIFKPTIAASDVQACFDPTEFAALDSLNLNRLAVLLSGGFVNSGATNVRTIIATIFPSGGPTRTALVALAQRMGSRAEFLFGAGTSISALDIAKALGRT